MPRPERPKEMSATLWESLQTLSPSGGVDAPTDTTNKWAGDERAIALGQFIFFEPEISGDGSVSCASCHAPDTAFTDEVSIPDNGITGATGGPQRRTPSLLNVAFNDWYFWDGRVDTLWGQAVYPYENPVEMDGSRLRLANYIYDNTDVKRAYEDIFGELPPRSTIDPFPADGRPILEPVGDRQVQQNDAWESMAEDDREVVNQIMANVGKAIAAYEMQLVSMNAPFDQFVDQVRANPEDPSSWDAISYDAFEGARLFVEKVGCLECHDGPQFSNNEFHNLGVPLVEWAPDDDPGRRDGLPFAKEQPFSSAGEYSDDQTGQKASLLRALGSDPRNDLGSFRTPTLRNVAKRPPYMHAGQIGTLREAIEFYNEPPDGVPVIGIRDNDIDPLELSDEKIDRLVAFLESLDGEPVPEHLTVPPETPFPTE